MDKHIETFHFLIAKLPSYDKPISPEDKVSMLLCTLPEHFAPIAMVVESSSISFEQVVASVKAKISERRRHHRTELFNLWLLLLQKAAFCEDNPIIKGFRRTEKTFVLCAVSQDILRTSASLTTTDREDKEEIHEEEEDLTEKDEVEDFITKATLETGQTQTLFCSNQP